MDVIILIFLAIKIGRLAISKGLSAGKWRLNLALGWIVGEIAGALIGMIMFGIENQFSWIMIALGFSFTAYFIIRNHLSSLPNSSYTN